jgi:hypothetical protein
MEMNAIKEKVHTHRSQENRSPTHCVGHMGCTRIVSKQRRGGCIAQSLY